MMNLQIGPLSLLCLLVNVDIIYENLSDCLRRVFHEVETFLWYIHAVTEASISAKRIHLLQVILFLKIFVKITK